MIKEIIVLVLVVSVIVSGEQCSEVVVVLVTV